MQRIDVLEGRWPCWGNLTFFSGGDRRESLLAWPKYQSQIISSKLFLSVSSRRSRTDMLQLPKHFLKLSSHTFCTVINNLFSIHVNEQNWGGVNNQVHCPLPGARLSVLCFKWPFLELFVVFQKSYRGIIRIDRNAVCVLVFPKPQNHKQSYASSNFIAFLERYLF